MSNFFYRFRWAFGEHAATQVLVGLGFHLGALFVWAQGNGSWPLLAVLGVFASCVASESKIARWRIGR